MSSARSPKRTTKKGSVAPRTAGKTSIASPKRTKKKGAPIADPAQPSDERKKEEENPEPIAERKKEEKKLEPIAERKKEEKKLEPKSDEKKESPDVAPIKQPQTDETALLVAKKDGPVQSKRAILLPALHVRTPVLQPLATVELPVAPRSPPILKRAETYEQVKAAKSPPRTPGRVLFGENSTHSVPHRNSRDYLPDAGAPIEVPTGTLCLGDAKALFQLFSQFDDWAECQRELAAQSRSAQYATVSGLTKAKYVWKQQGDGWQIC